VPVVAGNVIVLVPAAAGADTVITPLVSPVNFILAIIHFPKLKFLHSKYTFLHHLDKVLDIPNDK
jgi:hypothetical protein